jgi:hypothetical protein
MPGYGDYYNEVRPGLAHSWQGGTAGVLYTERRDMYLNPYDMASLYPSVTPFLVFSSEVPVTYVDDPDYKMFEEDDTFVGQQFYLGNVSDGTWDGTTPGSSTTQPVDVLSFKALAYGENLVGLEVEIFNGSGVIKARALITAIGSGDTVTFRFLGGGSGTGGAPGDIEIGDEVHIIGNAQAEGTRSPEAWSTQPRVVWNSAQIEKTSLEITGTLYSMAKLRATKLNELVRLQQNKAREHMIQRERKNLFGWRVGGNDSPIGHLTDGEGKPIRTTMGIIPMFIEYGITDENRPDQNVFTRSKASYNFDDFVDDTVKMFQYIPNDGTLTAQVGMDALGFWRRLENNLAL